jgi:uncharacterized protein YbbK (DUF523 family)
MKIVSACLAGINCQWNWKSKPCEKVIELIKKGQAIPVCPEQLWGLTTPRSPAELKNDKVITKDWVDLTSQFEKWSQEVLKIAKAFNCNEAILKARSPSCGVGKVYDWTFSGKLIDWDGVTAKLLKTNNIKVKTEDEI